MAFVLLSGCNHNQVNFKNPEEQFVYIEGKMKISVCHKESGVCVEAGKGKGLASGVLISHNKRLNKSYYLTAGHVCEVEIDSPNELFDAKVEQEFHLWDKSGKDTIAVVIAVDKEHDLCLLESDMVSRIPAIIAKTLPRKHVEVINVAAPAGMWSKDTMLHFSGEFQGNYKGAHDEYDEEMAVYTIAAQKGSSGSPVYDPKSGKLIGIITSVVVPSYDIAIGPTLEQINEFVDANLPS